MKKSMLLENNIPDGAVFVCRGCVPNVVSETAFVVAGRGVDGNAKIAGIAYSRNVQGMSVTCPTVRNAWKRCWCLALYVTNSFVESYLQVGGARKVMNTWRKG
jgi:hypothetical protein